MEGGAEHWSSQALIEVGFYLHCTITFGKTVLHRALSDTTIYIYHIRYNFTITL